MQSELNRRIEEFSAIIRGIAPEEGTDYIALYEAMFAQVMKSPGRAFTEFGFLPFYRDAFRTLALRKSPDEVAGSMAGAFTATASISIVEVD